VGLWASPLLAAFRGMFSRLVHRELKQHVRCRSSHMGQSGGPGGRPKPCPGFRARFRQGSRRNLILCGEPRKTKKNKKTKNPNKPNFSEDEHGVVPSSQIIAASCDYQALLVIHPCCFSQLPSAGQWEHLRLRVSIVFPASPRIIASIAFTRQETLAADSGPSAAPPAAKKLAPAGAVSHFPCEVCGTSSKACRRVAVRGRAQSLSPTVS
jgi:hypothetical protein